MNIPANATGIERTVCTYRITSRQGRKILGRGNPLARGLDANRSVKRRAVTNILGAGPDLGLTPDQLAELSHALYLEDAALHQLGHLRMTGAHQADTLTEDGIPAHSPAAIEARESLAKAKAARRAILYGIERGHI